MGILDTVSVVSAWASTSEPVEWIAERTDALAQRLTSDLGATRWELSLPSSTSMTDEEETWSSSRVAWEGDKSGLVRRCAESETVESDTVHEGYTLNLYAGTPRGEIVVMRVRAGGALLGRRVPLHTTQVEVMAARGDAVPSGVTESLVRAVAEVFAPLKVTETSSGVGPLARRGGWKIGPGRELWLHESVLSDGLLPEGMSKKRVGHGWLYTVPGAWTLEQVVTAHDDFRELNQLDVLPH